MPIFLDRHDIPEAMTAEEIARLHAQDVKIQGKYGVRYITYWCDPPRRCAFCLVDAPTAELAVQVHRESHGELPSALIPVEMSAVMSFLGRIADPSQDSSERGIIEAAHRTVLFTDIVNSMELTDRLGDARSVEFVRSHDQIVRAALRDDNGREVKHTGDGIMASFADARRAVACARAILRGMRDFNHNSADPLHLRVGVHLGQPVEDSQDLFGKTVQIAARICADASLDSVVVSDEVREALDGAYVCLNLGRRVLKGVAAPITVYAVDWE